MASGEHVPSALPPRDTQPESAPRSRRWSRCCASGVGWPTRS